MTSVNMQSALTNAELALDNVALQSQAETISLLSNKFGFDEKEAKEFLSQLSVTKSTHSANKVKGHHNHNKNKNKKTCSLEEDTVLQVKNKRAPSGYMLFSTHIRPDVIVELNSKLLEGEKLKGPDIMKGIANKWKSITDTERASWNTKAKNSNSSNSSN